MSIKIEYAPKLIDWYWEHGSKRQGIYALSRGGWLDRALRLLHEHEAIVRACTQFSRPTMALWGPSQSGKSTLLAPFIDAEAQEKGYSESLCWGGVRARFSGNNQDGDTAILNPYNLGADASGCVTRYTLRRQKGEENPEFSRFPEVEYPEWPVEVEFAGEREILFSLAVGYLSETNGKDQNGEEVLLSSEKLEEITQKVITPSAVANKEAYTQLVEVLNVMDALVDMEFSRYSGLRSEWPQRRMALLSHDALISSVDVVLNFAAELFWDAWPKLTSVYRRLRLKSREFPSTKRYFCDIRMAALLLNISSVSDYQLYDSVRQQVTTCTHREIAPGVAAFSADPSCGARLFPDIEDFALTQALVSLITVPLRCDVMLSQSMPRELRKVLAMADLLDFPGVANENKAAEGLKDNMLDLGYRPDAHTTPPMWALTKLMKRGKTASIVLSKSRDLNIDAFSLLVRMPTATTYPAHPDQLMRGIRSWFKAMGIDPTLLTSSPITRQNTPAPSLKTNLVLTFSAKLINVVLEAPNQKLYHIFKRFDSLGGLAAPQIVTTTCINYPQFEEGEIHTESGEELMKALETILRDESVKMKLPQLSLEELREMADYPEESSGGRLCLFRKWEAQLSGSPRLRLLAEKQEKLLAEWELWRKEALPEANNNDTRKQDIDKIIHAAGKPQRMNKALARQILTLENIDPEWLEIPPYTQDSEELHSYALKQTQLWLESARQQPLQSALGFEDMEHRSRVLNYFAEKISGDFFSETTAAPHFLQWLNSIKIDRCTSSADRTELRRLVATYMSNQLFSTNTPHRTEQESITLLGNMGKLSYTASPELSPQFLSIIQPFLTTLKHLRDQVAPGERPEQPGDNELRALLQLENRN